VFTVSTAEARLLCSSSPAYNPNASSKSLMKSPPIFFDLRNCGGIAE
jgi:hypothetical protein